MVIIENIVENLIEVKYEDESTTHNPQVSVDLLKMTIQYVDFLEVENFNFSFLSKHMLRYFRIDFMFIR